MSIGCVYHVSLMACIDWLWIWYLEVENSSLGYGTIPEINVYNGSCTCFE